MLQYYSALPFNITSGVTTVQGTAGRPIVNGAFIDRNAGTGPDFLSLNVRVSRSFRVSQRLRNRRARRGIQPHQSENVVTVNGNFGPGAYPANPSSTFGQVTAVGDPRSLQVAIRAKF